MAQQPLEVILAKQLASHLASPVFIVDPDGVMLFYNEPAEALLGMRFEETGPMPTEDWSTLFAPTDPDDHVLRPDDLPLAVALRERRPAHAQLRIRGLDGVDRRIVVTAFPLEGHAGRRLGAMAMFWEDKQ